MNQLQTFLTIAAIGITTAAFAQTDTTFTTISQESGALASQQFTSETERAYNFMTPAKWMFKADLGYSLSNIFDNPGVRVSAETKLSKALSISANLQYDQDASRWYQMRLGTTLRWYYDMKKRIAAGRSASNFSGNYLAIEPAWLREKGGDYIGSGIEFIGKFGIQRRLLRYGYFDLSYGIGVRHYSASVYSRKRWYFSTQPQLSLGLALFSPRKNNLPDGTVCDVTRCFQETNRMFKIDLYNLLVVRAVTNQGNSFSLNPSFAYEQKISGSPFSAELSLGGTSGLFAYNPTFSVPIKGNLIGGNSLVELRWYFLQKKRLLQGKSGNNLSGAFWGLHAAYEARRSQYKQTGFNLGSTFFNSQSVRTVLGVQHRILNRGFVQFKIGAGAEWSREKSIFRDGQDTDQKYGPRISIYSELKAGLAF